MIVYIEALILYVVLFFSGPPASAEYSIAAEISKILLYCIPSIALIWYLLSRNWKIEYWIIKPGRKDLIPGLITLPCLLVIGSVVGFASSITGGTAAPITLPSPSSVAGWIVLFISCISAAYLEESFFRFYLLSKREEMNLNVPSALALSTLLFSICHIYSGPWGFLNAAIAGLFLGFMFLRYNCFHGIAIAHGLYNIAAYAINANFQN
jgi:hypothetical protein